MGNSFAAADVGAGGLADELIVCTRNRTEELSRCLQSVAVQSRMPTKVRVVDSSDDDKTEIATGLFSTGSMAGRLVYQRARPGLTTQRNAGLRSGTSDLVHFVDDDVILDPDYVAAIVGIFASDQHGSTLGVGGLVTNMHHEPASRGKQFFGLYGNRPGQVLRSGRNVLALDITSETEVDWLSGCSMSYRRCVFDGLAFDEELLGYGLGEDVELSYRVRQSGRLLVTPMARLEHHQSQRNRMQAEQYHREELMSRARRVRTRIGRLRMRWYWWSVFGQVLGLAFGAAFGGPGRARARLRISFGAVIAVLIEQWEAGDPARPSASHGLM